MFNFKILFLLQMPNTIKSKNEFRFLNCLKGKQLSLQQAGLIRLTVIGQYFLKRNFYLANVKLDLVKGAQLLNAGLLGNCDSVSTH